MQHASGRSAMCKDGGSRVEHGLWVKSKLERRACGPERMRSNIVIFVVLLVFSHMMIQSHFL